MSSSDIPRPRKEPLALGPIILGVVALLLMLGVPAAMALLVEPDARPSRTDALNMVWFVMLCKIAAGIIALVLVLTSDSIWPRICGWIVIALWIVQLVIQVTG